MSYMAERIEWSDDAARHIRTRSTRYPGDTDIEPAWTAEAVNDPRRLVAEPDPKSAHINSVRTIGYSSTAQVVITVCALRDARGVQHGATAWKTRRTDLRQYHETAQEQDHNQEEESADDRRD
jgi:hypothetical protein